MEMLTKKALLNVADRLIEQEAEGLYLMGSTAEAFFDEHFGKK